ncbi:hypothetical protein [Nostoc commune]|uniref:hypothetical protein n=1 Tax=Nostoc commune TaxID=1178 RepID=UPI0018C51D88|nr:hypothetical protein [Nostoc commune]MBG1264747.1 hypothetical protein [Nostoc commune BAE]
MVEFPAVQRLGKAIFLKLCHVLCFITHALDIRHQLIKILVEWQISSKNTHGLGIGQCNWRANYIALAAAKPWV